VPDRGAWCPSPWAHEVGISKQCRKGIPERLWRRWALTLTLLLSKLGKNVFWFYQNRRASAPKTTIHMHWHCSTIDLVMQLPGPNLGSIQLAEMVQD